MASATSLPALFSRLTMHTTTSLRATATTTLPTMTTLRAFSTTSSVQARKIMPSKSPKGKGKVAPKSSSSSSKSKAARSRKKGGQGFRSESFMRIRTLRQNMFSPAPPPLRMARQRYLRHWTIHRAWQLFRRQQREELAKERSRMHAGMYNACEELRKTVGPGERNEGYLYRVAMEKKGVYGTDAVPIEYARLQTDSPAKKAWDHGWKR